MIAVRTM